MSRRSKGIALSLVFAGASLSATAHANRVDASGGSDNSGDTSIQRTLGVVVATAGLVGFGAGVILGRERAKRDDATAHCSVDVCQSMATLILEDARSQSNTAFRLMSASALAMVSGIAIYLLAPASKRKSALDGTTVALGAGGITFKTTF